MQIARKLILIFGVVIFLWNIALLYAEQSHPIKGDHENEIKIDNALQILSEEEIQSIVHLPINKERNNISKEKYFSESNIEKRNQIEKDFGNFNLLRNFANKITIIYFKNQKPKPDHNSSSPWKFTVDESHYDKYVIEDENELLEWKNALSASIIREITSPFEYYGVGSNDPEWLWDALGIIFETDKEKVFIWVTDFAFYLGSWENFDFDRRFYSPELAFVLVKYIEKHSLNDQLPTLLYDGLAGKHLFRSMRQIERDKARKNEMQSLPDGF